MSNVGVCRTALRIEAPIPKKKNVITTKRQGSPAYNIVSGVTVI